MVILTEMVLLKRLGNFKYSLLEDICTELTMIGSEIV